MLDLHYITLEPHYAAQGPHIACVQHALGPYDDALEPYYAAQGPDMAYMQNMLHMAGVPGLPRIHGQVRGTGRS